MEFIFYLYSLCFFTLFSFLILLARTYAVMLNKSGGNELPSLVFLGRKKVLNISPFSLMLAIYIS